MTKSYHLRQEKKFDKIKLVYYKTSDHVGNVLIKTLSKVKFEILKDILKICNNQVWIHTYNFSFIYFQPMKFHSLPSIIFKFNRNLINYYFIPFYFILYHKSKRIIGQTFFTNWHFKKSCSKPPSRKKLI